MVIDNIEIREKEVNNDYATATVNDFRPWVCLYDMESVFIALIKSITNDANNSIKNCTLSSFTFYI